MFAMECCAKSVRYF